MHDSWRIHSQALSLSDRWLPVAPPAVGDQAAGIISEPQPGIENLGLIGGGRT
jgi:hypothetical protein